MTEGEQHIPDEWLVAAARMDPAAFTLLYRRHYDVVLRHCVRRLFDRSAAEDVTSAVFLSVVKNLHKLNGDGQAFRRWLYKITSNAVNDHLRTSRRRSSLFHAFAREIARQAATDDGPPDAQAERMAVVKKAVLTLAPVYQSIICLRFFEGKKLTEVADLLGTSPATVRSQLFRALACLRKAMASEAGDS
jgi:RNA polymerase sigma-70 factor, ECF subfamily